MLHCGVELREIGIHCLSTSCCDARSLVVIDYEISNKLVDRSGVLRSTSATSVVKEKTGQKIEFGD